MKNILKRKNLRIPEYNYSQEGLYFITICTKNRKCVLSKIHIDEEKNTRIVNLLPYGKITENNLMKTNKIYNELQIHNYIIMPNHIHFIVEIVEGNSKNNNPTKLRLPFFISSLKRIINKECNEKIWQRNYYEHIIRNEKEYLEITEYIEKNPYKWEIDMYYIKN